MMRSIFGSYDKEDNHDGLIMLLCFIGCAVLGYLVSTHFAIFGV